MGSDRRDEDMPEETGPGLAGREDPSAHDAVQDGPLHDDSEERTITSRPGGSARTDGIAPTAAIPPPPEPGPVSDREPQPWPNPSPAADSAPSPPVPPVPPVPTQAAMPSAAPGREAAPGSVPGQRPAPGPVPGGRPVARVTPVAWEGPARSAPPGPGAASAHGPGLAPGADDRPPPGPAPYEPMSRRTKRNIVVWLIVAVLLVALVISAVVVFVMMNRDRDPAETVEDYLSLIEEGRGNEANELVGTGLDGDEAVLLSDEVLGAASEPMVVEGVETLDRGGDGATVEATLSVGGEEFVHEFEVEPGPKEMLFLDTWTLDEPLLAEIELGADGLDALTVGGAEVALDGESRTVHVYPGVYEVTGSAGDYFDASTEEVAALPDEGARALVTVEPSDEFEAEVMRQVTNRITACTKVPTNMDAECPSITQSTRLDELRVLAQPSGFEEIDETRFETTSAEIAVRSVNSSREHTSSFAMSGTVEMVDGEPVVRDLRSHASYS